MPIDMGVGVAEHAFNFFKGLARAEQSEEGEYPESWAEPIELVFIQAAQATVRDLAADVRLLVGEDVTKAEGAPLTLDQIADLKLLVRQHYLSRLMPSAREAFWMVAPHVRLRWERLGLIGPRTQGNPLDQIDEMAVAARVAEILEHGTSYRRMREMATERPETRALQLARVIARERCGYAIGRLADRHGDLLVSAAFPAWQRDQLGTLVAEFLAGRLRRGGLEVRGSRGLASALREVFRDRGIERDWRRIAVSETRFAFNYGSLVSYLERGHERIYYVVQPNACERCKALLLQPDGTPKIFGLDDIIENVALTGGTNAGRKPDDWLVTAIIHPWCRCRPLPYLEGLPFAPVGDLRDRRAS